MLQEEKVKSCKQDIKNYTSDLIKLLDNNYPEEAFNICLKIIDGAKCEINGWGCNQALRITLNNKEIECDLENTQTRKELKAFVEYELNRYKDDNIKLKALEDTDAIFISEVRNIVSQIIDKEDIKCKDFSAEDIDVDLIRNAAIKEAEIICEIEVIVEKFKDKVFKRFDLKGDVKAKIVELIKKKTLKYLSEFVEKKINLLNIEAEQLEYKIEQSKNDKLVEDNKTKLKVTIRSKLDLLDKDSFESTEYFSITKHDLVCSFNDKIDSLEYLYIYRNNLDQVLTNDEISEIALNFIKFDLDFYNTAYHNITNHKNIVQDTVEDLIKKGSRGLNYPYNEIDIDKICSHLLDTISFGTYLINDIKYTFYDESENINSLERELNKYINNLEAEDEKSTNPEVNAYVINKSILNLKFLEYDNLKLEDINKINTLLITNLYEYKYSQLLNNPILLQEEYPQTSLILQSYKKLISVDVIIVKDDYIGPYLLNNCNNSKDPHKNLIFCSNKGFSIYQENDTIKMHNTNTGETTTHTMEVLHSILYDKFKLVAPSIFIDKKHDEFDFLNYPTLDDTPHGYYGKLHNIPYKLINYTDKKFNPSVNARFYIDSKSKKNVINTFEDISNKDALECEDTDYQTINKVIEHIFKGNNEAIIIFYTVLSSFIKNRVAPDFWLIFKVEDPLGLGFELLYRTIILPIFKAKQCLLLEGTELYGKLTKDIFENIIIYINNLPTGITKTQEKQLNKNIALLRNDCKQYNLMFVKTVETTALNIKRDPNSYQVFEINSDVNENNFLGFQTEKKLERAIESEVPAFIKMLHNLNVAGNIKDIDSLDNEIRNICITSGTRIDVHLEAYLTKNISVFEPLSKATNAKDRELLIEIKKNFNHKKPFLSQQLISKVWIALERDSKSTSDILDRFKASDTLFFSKDNSQQMSNSDVRYFIDSEYNKYFKNNS